MNCPRCGFPLCKKGPTRRWQIYFECEDCCVAFELIMEQHMRPSDSVPQGRFLKHTWTLCQGRTPAYRPLRNEK